MRGLFVTFEGGEGAGKSTLLRSLREHFEKSHHQVVATREPGGTQFGEELRGFILSHSALKIEPRAELFLFLAARAQHVEELIRPELEKGSLILCDRFSDSTVAYQGAARGLGIDMVREACSMATGGLEPDLTIYVDIAPDAGLARTRGRGPADRIEQEKIHFHETVRSAFLDIARHSPDRVVILDGLLPKEVLFRETLTLIERRLGGL